MNKIVKTDREIVPASNIAEKIERALKSDDKPANRGFRWPSPADECRCGHTYSFHNYSDSLGSKTDPLGFMYECRGAGFRSMSGSGLVPDGQRPVCACKKFDVATVGIGDDAIVVGSVTVGAATKATINTEIAPIAQPPQLIITSEVKCIGVDGIGPHVCPGYVYNALGGRVYCQCACSSCLSMERKMLRNDMGSDARGVTAVATPVNGDVQIVTDENMCLIYGVSDAPHYLCEVTGMIAGTPTVCMCECIECKRAWFSDGRPLVRNGQIVRTTPESTNPVKTTAEDVARWEEMRK